MVDWSIFERLQLENANEFGRVVSCKTVLQTVSLQHMRSNVSCDVTFGNRTYARTYMGVYGFTHIFALQSDFVRTVVQLHCQDFSKRIVRQMFVSLRSPPMIIATYSGSNRALPLFSSPRVNG